MCAIAGVCRDWAMITLASSSGEVWTEVVDDPWLSPDGLGVRAGPLRADGESLRVELGPGLDVRFDDRREWPRRAFSPLGPAQMVPFLGQYWAPWLLSARVSGTFGARSLDGVSAYAEKNWGAVFAPHWWWGQAEFVAFAGGRVHGVAPTAVAVWTPDELVTLAPPFARTVARAGGGEWAVRASNRRWRVELEGEADAPLHLPVPIPDERRLEVRSRHSLLGRVSVVVRRGRRVWFRGESSTAALEDGATPA
ncbi:tocopherol cyclase family protein [Solirubrobacter phytolaccae]|uniref:Tocopherol cyclase family protein n=1 Tax=Solirubrobacter phytolaccae TaxID=1404360 RepID=A0A9X3NCH0_9ACTN|nr:tocopherol cyclase family protein [Solirubrobacter phytolaccae]MDA0183928.1 tocopherol cyclase family protein [Solirubrobacter phytolaccae]